MAISIHLTLFVYLSTLILNRNEFQINVASTRILKWIIQNTGAQAYLLTTDSDKNAKIVWNLIFLGLEQQFSVFKIF